MKIKWREKLNYRIQKYRILIEGNMKRGRKSGYKHSEFTKNKISRTMSGRNKTEEHKDRIAIAMYDLDGRCARRLKELREDYPEQKVFFDKNEAKLLFALRDLKSEKELNDIQRYTETKELTQIPESQKAYQYSSSSYFAAEDVMIELIDFKRFLERFN